MNRASSFSYQCNQCGRCCHDQVITLSPWDVLEIARAARITTGEAVSRYTERRGSLLKFGADGGCVALDGVRCMLHQGRPLACRLYPLALEREDARDGTPDTATEQFVTLEPADGSLGVFAKDGTIEAFLTAQGVPQYLAMNTPYARLLPVFRRRIADLVDFDTVEPREFWRRAVAEALRESGFDPNPLIDALFDPDALGCGGATDADTVAAHVQALEAKIRAEVNPEIIATAAVMLAVSLGYAPEDAMNEE